MHGRALAVIAAMALRVVEGRAAVDPDIAIERPGSRVLLCGEDKLLRAWSP